MDPEPGCSKDLIDDVKKEEGEKCETYAGFGLLDLSDDVLLIILKHCSPRDLKALGFSCPRLGRLICDRSLWCRVDARSHSVGRSQLSWYLDHVVSGHTTSLAVKGFAIEAKGCLGTVDVPRPILDPVEPPKQDDEARQASSGLCRQPCVHIQHRHHPQLPRFNLSPVWNDSPVDEKEACEPSLRTTGGCGGPCWTMSKENMARLSAACPRLTELRIDHVNIDCSATPISSFPKTLKTLSMRGSRCYNMQMNKSYLFRIHDFLPLLEYLDLSECTWVEPSTLVPLSKMPALKNLQLERCRRLAECVAYASLASRYGFRKLEVLNILGTPMSDSEVSGLGWLPELRELYMEPGEPHVAVDYHSHYLNDARCPTHPIEEWEMTEPEYFSEVRKESSIDGEPKEEAVSAEDQEERRIATMQFRRCLRNRRHPHYDNITESIRNHHQNFLRWHMRQLENEAANRPDEAQANGGAEANNEDREAEPRPAEAQNGDLPDPQAEDLPRRRSNRAKKVPEPSPSAGRVTRSRAQKELEEKAGPSGRTRSKKPIVDSPSTSGTKRKQPQAQETPRKKTRTQQEPRAEPRPVQEDRQQRFMDLQQQLRHIAERNLADRGIFVEREGLQMRRNRDDADGRVHVIYVNVRRPGPDVLRVLLPEREREGLNNPEPNERNGDELDHVNEGNREFANILRLPFIHSFLYGPSAAGHISGATLITDAAINRFGRAENADDINYVHIGPHGAFRAGPPVPNASERPDKSKLRVLVVRGFPGITNRTLNHLVTAAPDLRYLDVTGTKINEQDVLAFNNVRPECEVKYGKTG